MTCSGSYWRVRGPNCLVPDVRRATNAQACLQSAAKSTEESKVFVCVSNNRVDAVNRLLISVWGRPELSTRHILLDTI